MQKLLEGEARTRRFHLPWRLIGGRKVLLGWLEKGLRGGGGNGEFVGEGMSSSSRVRGDVWEGRLGGKSEWCSLSVFGV